MVKNEKIKFWHKHRLSPTVVLNLVAPNMISITSLFEICSKDSGVTGHFSTSLQHKNMQSNKHVLIHTSKFKNTSVVFSFFYYVDDKVYWVDTVSEIMSSYWMEKVIGGRGRKQTSPLSKFMASSTSSLAWICGQWGNVTVSLLAINPCFNGPKNLWNGVTTLTRRHFLELPRVLSLNHEMKA